MSNPAMISAVVPRRRLELGRWPVQLGLLVLWAVLMALAFPRPGLWPLAHVALAPLTIAAICSHRIRRTAGMALGVGFVWWLVMIYWMAPVTWPGYVGLALVEGCFVALYVLIIRLVARGSGGPRWLRSVPLVVLVPIVWVGLEYVPGAIIVDGFPWFLIAHSQPTWYIQFADLLGVYGVSLTVAMTGGMIADVVLRRRMAWRFSVPAWGLITAAVIGYGAYRLDQSFPHSAAIRIAVIQPNVPQSNKEAPTDEQDRADFRQMLELSRKAMASKPDLIVWPETMVPRAINDESMAIYRRLNHPDQMYRLSLESFASRHHVNMIVGAHGLTQWKRVSDGWRPGRRYNSAYLVTPTGVSPMRFDKMHRVPFGEYIPGLESIPWAKALLLKLTPYDYDYSLQAGRKATVFDVRIGGAVWRVGTPICFEDVLGDVPRTMVWSEDDRKRVDVLTNISNDGWFAGTAEGPQHERIARFRCVENRVPMARSVNTGISSFIDSDGRVIERVSVDGRSQGVAGFAVGELWRDPRVTLYGRVGDAAGAAAMWATLGLIGVAGAAKLWRRGHAA